MPPRIVFCLVSLGLLLGPLAGDAQTKKAARFYVKIYSVAEPKGTKPSLKPRAAALLKKLLGKHPEIVMDLGQKVTTKDELARALAAKKLKGYELGLRLTKAAHAMHPPQPGKVYKVLMVEVAVAIDMQKIPTDQMALAGEGSAQVGVETARLKEKERVELLHEALDVAMKQAVSRTVFRLKNPIVTSKPKPRRRKKRRKRRSRKKRRTRR